MYRLEKTRRKRARGADWRGWLTRLFPSYVSAPFAARHIELWEWLTVIEPGVRPRPFVAIWGRGGAKSTTAELGCVFVGDRKVRNYIWYVSGTQDKADRHVETIGSILESKALESHNPELANRMVGKYGSSKGWRRERLRTSSGLTIDALGLDTGARGAKVEEHRPDMMIFDDVDELYDSAETTRKKIDKITSSLLPAGSNDCATLFIQNLIFPDSVASQLADGRADFLADRIVSGPHPAVIGLTYENRFDPELGRNRYFVTGGQATWLGQDLETCQAQINDWGLTSFLREAQHEVEETGGIWDHIEFRYCDYDDVPWTDIVRTVVWVDPAVTSTDESDCQGIQADGITENGNIYRLFSWEGIDSPESALKRAILKGIELKAQHVGVETDQGGDTWLSVYQRACDVIKVEQPGVEHFPAFAGAKAGAGHGGKVERNSRMLVDYEHGKVIHVRGTHGVLDRALRRFPKKPLDLVDAGYWAWDDLRNTGLPAGEQIDDIDLGIYKSSRRRR